MKTDNLTYRLFNNSIDDVQLIKECFESNSMEKDFEKLKWLYLDGNEGQMEVYLAIDERNKNPVLAGMYAMFPVKFKIGQKRFKGLQSLDTLTNLNYRGQGLFKMLSSMLYDLCEEKDYTFVYGFPNANSAHGFFNKLDWLEVGEVPFLMMPVNLNYFIKKVPLVGNVLSHLLPLRLIRKRKVAGNKIKSINQFDDTMDDLWSKYSELIEVAVDRDCDYLNWRYIKKPKENYIIKGYFENEKLEAFIVYCVKEKHNGKIGYIMEFVYNPENKKAADVLMKFAINDLLNCKIDVCLSWVFEHSMSYKVFKKNNFFNLPKFLRPIELHFGIKKLNGYNMDEIDEVQNWYLSYSDSDTV